MLTHCIEGVLILHYHLKQSSLQNRVTTKLLYNPKIIVPVPNTTPQFNISDTAIKLALFTQLASKPAANFYYPKIFFIQLITSFLHHSKAWLACWLGNIFIVFYIKVDDVGANLALFMDIFQDYLPLCVCLNIKASI